MHFMRGRESTRIPMDGVIWIHHGTRITRISGHETRIPRISHETRISRTRGHLTNDESTTKA